jgi:hypothetical protein
MAYGTVKVDNITFDNGGSDQNVTVSGLYRATTSGVTVSGTIAATTVSGVTVIGSTTVSGATVTGTTANFTSGNFSNIISSAATMSGALIMASQQQVRFRELDNTNHIALQAPAIVSADQTITLPEQTGTLITTGDNGSVSSTMLATNLTISAAAGSATTPSIAFTGDLNTGIYSPGADQLAAATNGAQRVFVGSTGNVGIGPSVSLGAKLDVNETGTTSCVIRAKNDTTSVYLDANNGYSYLNTFSNHPMLFGTNNAERLRIDSSGNVGIGTSSPGYALDVASADTTASTGYAVRIRANATAGAGALQFTDSGATAQYGLLVFGANGVGTLQADGASSRLVFGTNSTERLRIDSSGNVGIGTTSPTTTLDVNGDVTITDKIIHAGDTNTAIRFPAADTVTVETSGAERVRVDSVGRLLVGTSTARQSRTGTTSFLTQLQIETSGSDPGIAISRFINTGSPSYLCLQKGRGSIASPATVIADDLTGRIIFSGWDGSNFTNTALIESEVDGTPGANDMPGRLIFYTTPAGSAVPTERLRIKSDGESYFQADNTTSAVTINQIGTGNALVVEDTTNPDASPFVIDQNGRTVQGHTVALSLNGTGGAPTCQLHAPTSTLFAGACYSAVSWSNGTVSPGIFLAKARAGAVGTYTAVPNNQNLGEIRFAGADGSQFQLAASIRVEADGTPSTGIVPGRILFQTANSSGTLTEAMRVNSGQELLIGYTADNGAYKLQVNSQIFATSATIATSDGRYKENVATLNGCIDLVNALRPVSFDWKPQQDITRIDEDGNSVLVREGHNFPDGKQVGFIAQEVQEVLADKPWLGSVIKQNVRPAIEDADGNELAPEEEFFGIAEGNLTAVLTAALQEAIAKINALEARIAALEA